MGFVDFLLGSDPQPDPELENEERALRDRYLTATDELQRVASGTEMGAGQRGALRAAADQRAAITSGARSARGFGAAAAHRAAQNALVASTGRAAGTVADAAAADRERARIAYLQALRDQIAINQADRDRAIEHGGSAGLLGGLTTIGGALLGGALGGAPGAAIGAQVGQYAGSGISRGR